MGLLPVKVCDLNLKTLRFPLAKNVKTERKRQKPARIEDDTLHPASTCAEWDLGANKRTDESKNPKPNVDSPLYWKPTQERIWRKSLFESEEVIASNCLKR